MEENSKIMIIFNRYKDTFDDFIGSSDSEFLDWLKSIDKK